MQLCGEGLEESPNEESKMSTRFQPSGGFLQKPQLFFLFSQGRRRSRLIPAFVQVTKLGYLSVWMKTADAESTVSGNI